MYKKGCENASQSLSVSTSEILSKQTFLSVFPDIILTESARRDPMCGYARPAYENITCTLGFKFLQLFPIDCTSLNNGEKRTRRRPVWYTHASTLWFISTAQYPLTFIFRTAMTTVTHTSRWLTDDGLWRNKLSESKQGCISYQSSVPSISKACLSKDHFSLLMTGTVGYAALCSPRGQGSSPGTPLPAGSKGRGVTAPGTHPGQGELFPHFCLSSGVLFPSPNPCHYWQTVPVSPAQLLNPRKGRKHSAGRLPEGLLQELSEAQLGWKGWRRRRTCVCTPCPTSANSWAEAKPEAQVPHCSSRSGNRSPESCRASYLWRVEQLFFCGVSPGHSLLWCIHRPGGRQPQFPTSQPIRASSLGSKKLWPPKPPPHGIKSDPGAGKHSHLMLLAGQATALKLQRGETRAQQCGGTGQYGSCPAPPWWLYLFCWNVLASSLSPSCLWNISVTQY